MVGQSGEVALSVVTGSSRLKSGYRQLQIVEALQWVLGVSKTRVNQPQLKGSLDRQKTSGVAHQARPCAAFRQQRERVVSKSVEPQSRQVPSSQCAELLYTIVT